MFLLFHHEHSAKFVRGGRTFVEKCPTCERPTRFREIEITEKQGIWGLEIDDDTRRAFRCDSCEDVFDLREPPPPARPVVAKLPEPKPQIDATRIEDELAELKKRMGK